MARVFFFPGGENTVGVLAPCCRLFGYLKAAWLGLGVEPPVSNLARLRPMKPITPNSGLSDARRPVLVGLVLVALGVAWWMMGPSGRSPHLALLPPGAGRPLTPEDFGMWFYLKVKFVRVGRFLGPTFALVGVYLVVFRGILKTRTQRAGG